MGRNKALESQKNVEQGGVLSLSWSALEVNKGDEATNNTRGEGDDGVLLTSIVISLCLLII